MMNFESLVEKRKVFFILSILVMLLSVAGLHRVRIEGDYLYYFREDDPSRVEYEKLQERFTKNDVVVIAVEPSNGSIYTTENIQALADLTQMGWQVPYSLRVESLSNFQDVVSRDDEVIVENLVNEENKLDQTRVDYIRRVAQENDSLEKWLVSENESLASVVVTVNLPGASSFETREVVLYVRKMVEDWEKRYPGMKTYLTGNIVLANAFNESAEKDMVGLTSLMYVLIFIGLLYLISSVKLAFSSIILVFISILSAFGIASWFNVPVTAPVGSAPPIILIVAIASSVHLFLSFKRLLIAGESAEKSLIMALKDNFRPIFLSIVTTAIGFLGLNFSENPAFRDLGNISAIGIGFVLLYLLLFLPTLLLSIFTIEVSSSSGQRWEPKFDSLLGFIIKFKGLIVVVFVALFALSVYLIPKIELNDRLVNYMAKGTEYRDDTDRISKDLSGSLQIEFDVPSGRDNGVSKYEYVSKLEEFKEWYLGQEGVRSVISIPTIYKKMHKAMNGGGEEFYKVPKDDSLLAQYLLLYEMSLPFGMDVNNLLSSDRRSSRVIISVDELDSKSYIQLGQSGEQWLKSNGGSGMQSKATGPPIMISLLSFSNVREMFKGGGGALFIITVLLIFTFASFRYGILSMFTNIFPSLLTIGLWVVFVGEAGFELGIVGVVTLGIVVDDTVHFLEKYIRARRAQGKDCRGSLLYAYRTSGVAIVFTSIVLSLGFLLLCFSDFRLNVALGAMSASVIVVAVIVDLVVLPAALVWLDMKIVGKSNAVS